MTSTKTSAQRLAEAVRAADRRMGPHRQYRRVFLRQYAGPYYVGAGGVSGVDPTGPEPLNLIYSLVSVILPHLVARNPRAMIRTPHARLRAQAEVFELAWNQLAGEIDLSRSLRTAVTDALFGAGIMKVGLGPAGDGEGLAEPAGYLHDNGQPFADPVDLEDYMIDPHARTREHAAFEGNRYRLPLEYVLESGLYDRALAENLTPRRGDGDRRSASEVSGPDTRGPDGDGYVKYAELIDLWLPNENVVVTLPGDSDGPQGFLREVEWYGPERGPYEVLGFYWVPDNVLPVPLVSLIFDLHVMINKIARKLGRQADRQKDLVLFDERISEEAEKVRDASDGEMVGVQNVDRYRQVSFGGANESGYEHLEFLFEQFRRIGGNTDLLGGIKPQSETLGQEEMLQANASARIEDMRGQLHDFTKRIGQKLAWYLWYDPLIELPLTKRTAAGDEIPVTFSARMREGDFLDYHFEIEPHSMGPDSPARRFRRTLEWIEKVILPTADLAAEQGAQLDAAKLARITARLLNIDGAEEFHLRQPAKQ
ncbi:MAG TPA: hypothetical protein VMZ50_06745 [Phycisphaerae bacterium]|nr:hypothetical protein [Phycisphaerae bacterium]